jgi:hypothetical protein
VRGYLRAQNEAAQRQQSISAFFDGLKGDTYRPEQRPTVYFVLCLIVATVSYSIVRSQA